jgi:hypothetical protein
MSLENSNIFTQELKKKNIQNLNVVDVGARNGIFFLPSWYCKISNLFGFEPNISEYKKLIDKNTDAFKLGFCQPEFKNTNYFNAAIWKKRTKKKLYITKAPGAITLVGRVIKKVAQNLSRENKFKENYYTDVQRIIKTKTINCNTIDNIFFKKKIIIDFLKLDVEGGEYNCLVGANKILKKKRVLVIKTEFLLSPYYNNTKILGYLNVYLNKFKYRLIYLDFKQSKYSWKKTNFNNFNDTKLIYAGDAYFILDPDLNKLNKEKFLRMGITLIALGFFSTGINFIKESKNISQELLNNILRLCKKEKKYLFYEYWINVPIKILNLLRFIKYSLINISKLFKSKN